MQLTLSAAQTVVSRTIAEARARSAKPLAVAVLDAGGHLVAFAREDGATIFRYDIARAKAMGALGMGESTRVITERAKTHSLFYQSVAAAVGGNLAFSPGGVLIRDRDQVIGAVGVSGDVGDCDEECAIAGIRAAGFNVENTK